MPAEESPWMAVMARAFAYIALHQGDVGKMSIGNRAMFLESLGIPRADVASMLNTSVATVQVEISKIKNKGGKRRGKRTKKAD